MDDREQVGHRLVFLVALWARFPRECQFFEAVTVHLVPAFKPHDIALGLSKIVRAH